MDARQVRDWRGAPVALSEPAHDLLLCLIEAGGGLVESETLFELWPQARSPEAMLSRQIWELRRALGDAAGAQRMIRRVQARGYRFVAHVERTLHQAVAASEPAPAAAATRSGIAPRDSSTLIGRRNELAQLGEALDDARAGRGQVRWLRGGAGLGKTRTIAEVVSIASRDAVDVCQAHCLDHEVGPPLWPFQQLARQLISGASESTVRRWLGVRAQVLVKVIPELVEYLPGLRATPARRPDDDRQELFDAVIALLLGAARERPLLLTIDDVHWADEATLALLSVLCERIEAQPILLVVGSRSAEHGRLDAVMSAVLQLRWAQGIDLQPLRREEVGALLAQQGTERRDSLVSRVHGFSQGNPFVVTQVSSLLREDDARTSLGDGDEALEGVVRRRLRQLPVECQGVLEVAAVLGREFQLPDLQRAAVRSGGRVLDLLYPALAGGIVRRQGPAGDTFAFTHETFREVLYGSLSEGRRARLHRAVADGIAEHVGDDPNARLSELAHHYHEAMQLGAARQALHYGRLAAMQALEATAFAESVQHFDNALSALELLSQGGAELSRMHAGLLLGLGNALRGCASASVEQVRAAYRDAFDQARAAGDTQLLAEAAMAHAGRGPMGSMPLREAGTLEQDEIDLLEQALALQPPAALSTRALLQAWLAFALYYSSWRERRVQLAFAAVELAREAADPHVLAETLLMCQSAVRGPAQLDTRLSALDEILQLTARLGLPGLRADALSARGMAQLERGALARAEADMEAVQALLDAHGHPRERRVMLHWRCMLLDLDGRFDEATALGSSARRSGFVAHEFDQANAIRQFFVRYLRGQSAAMAQELSAVAERYPLPVSWHCGLVSTRAEAGQHELARTELARLMQDSAAAIPEDHSWISSHAQLAHAAMVLGEEQHAQTLYDKLVPYAERVIVVGFASFCMGSVHRVLGGLALTMQRHDVAQAHLERAITVDATLGATLWLNASRLLLIEMLMRRQAPGDRRRARELLGQVGAYVAARDVPLLRRGAAAARRAMG